MTRRGALLCASSRLKSQGAKELSAMIKLAESEAKVVLSVKKLDADPYLLGVRNGVIGPAHGDVQEVRRDDYVVAIAGAAFDAQARCAPAGLSSSKKS